jgi:DNA repair protein RadC
VCESRIIQTGVISSSIHRHPREVFKTALAHNAAAVMLAHNHPSGNAEPSQADRRITDRLRDALALVDVRVVDHLVVGKEVISFAERGFV